MTGSSTRVWCRDLLLSFVQGYDTRMWNRVWYRVWYKGLVQGSGTGSGTRVWHKVLDHDLGQGLVQGLGTGVCDRVGTNVQLDCDAYTRPRGERRTMVCRLSIDPITRDNA